MRIVRMLYAVPCATVAVCALMAQSAAPVGGTGAAMAGDGVAPPTTSVKAPVLGYFFDQSRRQLRTIVGIPGSGYVDPATNTPSGAAVFQVAPSQDYALSVAGDSGQLTAIVFGDGAPAISPVPQAMSGASLVAISPTGSTALVYSGATHRAQVFTGFPGAPKLLKELDWSSVSGSLTAMAVDDPGDLALVSVQDGEAGLYAVSDAGMPMIYSAHAISSIEFFRNSRQALVAEPADNVVMRIVDGPGGPSPALLADASAGLSAPRVVAAGQDGSRAFVLDAAGVAVLPVSGGPATRLSCDCEPTSLQRMNGSDVFLLTPTVGISLAVLDASSDVVSVVGMPSEPPQSAALPSEKIQ